MWRVMRLLVMQYVVELHFNFGALKLFYDNFSAISFFRNIRSTSRSKHIDVKLFFVKEKVVESLISVKHMPTFSMLTNPLTKGLPVCVFQEHVTHMRLLRAYTLCFSGSFSFSYIL